MNLRPLHDRVIVKREEEEKTTAGGIVLPGSAAEKPSQGKVVAVGEGKLHKNGERTPLSVKEGDTVLFGKFSGSEVKVDGEEYIIMREDEIFAIVG
ncbi:co-chaperone GroES [Rappaport israeli]|uniref:co-chaperone GroES n=1 Tax=Rappaport israeli TaxID=1839807 RepID=UPI000930898A|nr:co-chaperone GroES [Rappaport israeli]